jgi:hypothetical protein
MFYIKGIGGYLCSTDQLKLCGSKGAPKALNADALEFSTKEFAEIALADFLKKVGNVPNRFEVVEE